MKEENTNQYSFDEACRFIIKLGERMHGYGPNAARLEYYLNRITKILGYQGIFRSTPDQISFAFSKDGSDWQKIHISAMHGTGAELNRLANVGELINELGKGKLSIAEASTRLDEIDKLPHPWGNAATALSYVLTGVAFPVLMGGSWMDLILSGILSLVVFFMVLKSGSWSPLKAEWLPLSTAFVAGILAGIARFFFSEINVVLVTLSAILILIPGYGISVGIVEIVTKHIASGLSNLVSGLIYLFKQFFGAWLGVKAVALVLTIPAATTATPIDSVWLWLFMPAIIIGLGIAFQTSYRDFLWTCLALVIAYLGTVFGGDWLGSNFGNLLGTIVLVLFTSLWARKTGRPPSIVLVPAFVLLVSGSIGFRGLAAFAAGNMQTGGPEFLQMFVVALTLAAGLVIGVTLLKPEKSSE
jgi:uncharacterized membrane protein YjjP (DUF1212 family)